MYKYSAITNGFYVGLHPEIPSDAVDVTVDEYLALHSAGGRIVPGPDGWPTVELYFPEPPTFTLEQMREAKEMEIRAAGSRRLEMLSAPYSLQERETWATQLSEAEAFLADTTAAAPMLDALSSARGIAKADLVALVMENANLFRVESGKILGQQQALLTRVWASVSAEELAAIEW